MNTKCITQDEWMQICGLLTLSREYVKKELAISEIIKQKFPFLDGYFTDESYEETTLEDVKEKWFNNSLINMTLTVQEKSN